MSDGYNGWKNWETRQVNLHFEETLRDFVENARAPTGPDLKDYMEEVLSEQVEGLNGFLKDLINGSLAEVDWWELMRHYKEDDEPDEDE